MNKDVAAKDIKQFCKDTNMTEAIAALHGNTPIPTHQQGSKAIDSIFISKTLLVEAKGSFLQFGEVTISDHQAVWLDIKATLVGMHQEQDIT